MLTPKLATRTLVAVAVLGFTACSSTPTSRITEKSAVFQTLTPEQQTDIRNGTIAAGFTEDMVYMALGRPTVVESTDGTVGKKWTYRNFYPSEHVAGESLYHAGSGGANESTSVRSRVGSQGAVSDSSMSSSGVADVEAALMEVWFRHGKVTRFKLTP